MWNISVGSLLMGCCEIVLIRHYDGNVERDQVMTVPVNWSLCILGDQLQTALNQHESVSCNTYSKGNLKRLQGLGMAFQLHAVTLEEIDGPILLLCGPTDGVTITVLGFSIMRWLTWHQACWHQKGFIFLKAGRASRAHWQKTLEGRGIIWDVLVISCGMKY